MEKRITYQHKNKTANTVTDFAELLSRQIPQKIQQSSLVPSPLDLSVRGRVRERSLIKNEITTRSSKPVFADLWSILIPQKTQQSSPTPSPLERAGVRLPAPSPLERAGVRLPVPFLERARVRLPRVRLLYRKPSIAPGGSGNKREPGAAAIIFKNSLLSSYRGAFFRANKNQSLTCFSPEADVSETYRRRRPARIPALFPAPSVTGKHKIKGGLPM